MPFFRARAAAPVATTTLGLRSCACARPKEVVVWYTNGARINLTRGRGKSYRNPSTPRTINNHSDFSKAIKELSLVLQAQLYNSMSTD